MQTVIDQLGNTVIINFPPARIISLVPSQTELLAHLELDASVVGITKFCIHPPHWRNGKAVIGGTKKIDLSAVYELTPDLIIANKEENEKGTITELQKKYPVWISDIVTLEDALSMIQSLGLITDRRQQAEELTYDIRNRFSTLQKVAGSKKVLYLIWRKPWMGAGANTFINSMLNIVGLQNCLHEVERYPTLSSEQIRELKPDYIFLSSEPFPFQHRHKQELQKICLASKIVLVDGEMFSWYGSRLLTSPAYFRSLTLD